MNETEAREALQRWRETSSQRDSLFRAAHEAGISKHQIHQLTGVARTTIDRILTPGAKMRTHTAVIDPHHAVTVIVSDEAGDRQALPETPLSARGDDLRAHAERFLGMEGWHLTGAWEAGEGELRAPVKRGPRTGDPEMRAAIVHGVAQYILRGEAHTKRPAHSDAQVLARVRRDLDEVAAYGYTFPEDTPEKIAADAGELARWQQDHNVNWQDWAFGH